MTIEQQDQPTEEQQIRTKLLRILNFVINEGETDDSPLTLLGEIEQISGDSGLNIEGVISFEELKADMWLPYIERKVRELRAEIEGKSLDVIIGIFEKRLPFIQHLINIAENLGQDVSDVKSSISELEQWAGLKERPEEDSLDEIALTEDTDPESGDYVEDETE